MNKSKQETVMLGIASIEQNIGQVPGLPANPREWTLEEEERLAVSLKETPELFEARPLIVYPYGGTFVIIGGNMRYAAARRNGAVEVPAWILPEETDAEKLKELVIKDNASFGEWDYKALIEQWADDNPLGEWGIPSFEKPTLEDLGAAGLPDELQDIDLDPDELEEITGEDECAREHIVITYDEDSRWKLEQVFGVRDITSRVIWRLEEIMEERNKTQEI